MSDYHEHKWIFIGLRQVRTRGFAEAEEYIRFACEYCGECKEQIIQNNP